MTTSADSRLERLLGGAPLAPLRKRLRQQFERAEVDGQVRRFRISHLTADEHAALASLLGRSVRFTNSMQVDVEAIDTSLRRAGIANSLRDALAQIDGPIVHLETARQRSHALWSGVIAKAVHPGLRELLQTPVGFGLLKRLSIRDADVATRLCLEADFVLKQLPAKGMTRSQLAADTLGDAHALDNGRPVATLVLAVWRATIGIDEKLPESLGDHADRPETFEARARTIWARAGILVNELARPALSLNLCAKDIPTYASVTGEPAYASLRFLLRSTPYWIVKGRTIFVCENPNLVAIAADRLGDRCGPLVCTDGMPGAAQRTLLMQLAHAGARLKYHGDFDWPGLRIGNHVIGLFGAVSWRFGADDYAAIVQSPSQKGGPLKGPEVTASWDASLTPAMRAHQRAIAEESIADFLLEDLQES